jgi:hypothetical protein
MKDPLRLTSDGRVATVARRVKSRGLSDDDVLAVLRAAEMAFASTTVPDRQDGQREQLIDVWSVAQGMGAWDAANLIKDVLLGHPPVRGA